MKRRIISIFLITALVIVSTVSNAFADSADITLNSISDKNPGDTVTISGTSSLGETSIKVIAPNNTVLYFDVEKGSDFSNTFRLPADAAAGAYTVVAGQGSTTAAAVFNVNGQGTVIPVTGVTLDKNSLRLKVGNKGQLTATVAPADATNKNVAWASGNRGIARVNSNGRVTAVSKGSTDITVTTADGSKTAICTVTVTARGSGSSSSGGNQTNPTTPTTPAAPTTPEEPTEPEAPEEPEAPPEESEVSDDVRSKYPWAADAIDFLAEEGIIEGTSETTFSPGSNINRADFVFLLVRALGLKAETQDSGFSDVNSDAYYADALAVARQLGIAKGGGDGRFNPEKEISRQDMMVLVARALKAAGKLDTAADKDDLKGYDDADEVSGYAMESVAALVKEGIIQGSDNIINPKGTATMAQSAVVIYRLLNK